jgi:hypothetical protein
MGGSKSKSGLEYLFYLLFINKYLVLKYFPAYDEVCLEPFQEPMAMRLP